MRPRPVVRRCVVCARPVLGLAGESVMVAPYLAEYWPGEHADFKALVGDLHVACLRSTGRSGPWTACLRRWAAGTGGRELLADTDRAVIRRPGAWLVVVDGADLTVMLGQWRGVRGTRLTLRSDAFSFDLYGAGDERIAAVAAAFAAGPVAAAELAGLLDVPWYDDRRPLTDATFTSMDETAEHLRTSQELVAVADLHLDLPRDVVAALAADAAT